jgi:outer membrane protein assembly factor BamA
MGRRRAPQFILLVVAYTSLCSPPIGAQLPQKLKRCLPYPTLADEIREMRGETHRKVTIDAVKFQGSPHLAPLALRQLIESLKQREFDGDSDWIREFEETVRGAWQDQGYFNAEVKAEAQLVSEDATRARVSVTVHVEEGLQFGLGDIRFRPADPRETLLFLPDELRKLIPLREGQLFNVAKIRDGLDALRKMYGTKGYIDFTATPITNVSDDLHPRVSLLMELDQQMQFRVGKIEVLGLDRSKESLLKWKLKPGDVFNIELFDDFFKDNKSLLPADASAIDVQVHRDINNGTVDLVFDFQTFPCPQHEN